MHTTPAFRKRRQEQPGSSIDWNKWAAIAQVFSAVGVLLTLAYLAQQTRYLAEQTEQNTAAVQASVRQAMVSEDRESLYKIIEYPFLTRPCNLTPEQTAQTRAYLLAFLRIRENHWVQFQKGVLDEATWETYRRALAGVVLNSETGRSLWQANRYGFDEGFGKSVDELMQQTPLVPCG